MAGNDFQGQLGPLSYLKLFLALLHNECTFAFKVYLLLIFPMLSERREMSGKSVLRLWIENSICEIV